MTTQKFTTEEGLPELKIQIRFNTAYPENSTEKWRIICNGEQHFCHEIQVNCPTFTSTDIVKEDGTDRDIEKHHISCVADTVYLDKENGITIAKVF
jgi:hypothetical protein